MNYVIILVSTIIGAYVGHKATLYLMRRASEPPEAGEEIGWECSECNFTASKPPGRCPCCGHVGTPVPPNEGDK